MCDDDDVGIVCWIFVVVFGSVNWWIFCGNVCVCKYDLLIVGNVKDEFIIEVYCESFFNCGG